MSHGSYYVNSPTVCGKYSPDHIVALSRGGQNTISNIQPLCPRCNEAKQAKTIDYRAGNQAPPMNEIVIPEYIDEGLTALRVTGDVHRTIMIACAYTGEKPRDLIERLAQQEKERQATVQHQTTQ